ncbi:MAG: bifunctional diaminohydroxyphosphoribosylaminopyrimidine deaminase/5-amino-6-(5-phosphoribosylamino)uracil reductase RibD [Saprospiraceae bacterium]
MKSADQDPGNTSKINDSEKWMCRALDLALRGNCTLINPRVGAVIVHDNRIIGEGYHAEFGGPHAEVVALSNVTPADQHLLRESTIYVSLEPCAHYGQTPPCVDRLIESGIPNVIISCIDPNPQVAGKGIERLKMAGVNVETGIMEKQGTAVLMPYLVQMKWKRPYVIIKYAQTQNGYIGQRGSTLKITGLEADTIAHLWRSEVDAILIGRTTADEDDPRLTTRLVMGRNPIRMVIDLEQKLKRTCKVFDDAAPTIRIINDKKGVPTQSNRFKEYLLGTEIAHQNFEMPIESERSLWAQVLGQSYQLGIGVLMVEGGAYTIQSLLESGHWDELRRFVAPINAGNVVAPAISIAANRIIEVGKDKLEIFYNSEM